MFVATAILVLLGGCRGLDSVPIIAGDHCAPDRDATVGCTRDGDTIELEACGGEALRLLGIDSPEIAHDSTEVDQCFGPEAAAWMEDRLLGVDVRLEFDATCADTYGRTLAYVWALEADGTETLVNEEIVREGYARVFEDFDDIRLADRLYAAQADAQSVNAGLWATCE
ncbi:MAG: thermonuclease family protein [Pseudomonadota bacterium]|nr:thermonuclease family protein [Pseudomonadota bacterium]